MNGSRSMELNASCPQSSCQRDKPQKTLFSAGFSRDILKQYTNIKYVNKITGKEIKFHKLQILQV